MAGYTPQERKKTALDNRKLQLTAPCPTAPDRSSTLIWQLVSNNPRITVYTNDPNDASDKNNGGKIQAALDAPTFFSLLGLIDQAIKFKPTEEQKEFSETVVNSNFTFFGGKRSEKPMEISRIKVGKDQEGCVWISILAYNKERPRIKFIFGPQFDNKNKLFYHNYLHYNGEPYTKAELSVLYARGYHTMLTNLMAHLLVTEYVEPPPPQQRDGGQRNGGGYGNGGQRSGGGGGNYNRNQQREGGQGGGSQRATDDFFDDEI